MSEDDCQGGCSRRGVMCGLSALSLLSIAGLSELVACDTGIGSSGTLSTGDGGATGGDGGTGDTGDTGDTGSSVCDQSNTVCIDLSDPSNANALGNVGDSGFVSVPGDTVIVVHVADQSYDALSAICTHAGCEVQYRSGRQDLYCACHASSFAMDGTVEGGPANRPLKVYQTEVRGSTLIIYT